MAAAHAELRYNGIEFSDLKLLMTNLRDKIGGIILLHGGYNKGLDAADDILAILPDYEAQQVGL